MKFTADRQTLLEAFQVVGMVISTRAVRPILHNVHIVAHEDGYATLMATDLEISMRYRVPLLSVEEAGEAVVPVGRIGAILREGRVDEVSWQTEDSCKVRLRIGRGRFDLLGENPLEFPAIPEYRANNEFGLQKQKLQTLIRKTLFAVAKEKSRFAFNGAKLDISGNEVRMIATDGKRMAMKVEEIDNTDGVQAGHIISARALATFERVLGDDDDVVRVALEERDVMIKTARAEISSKLVEGRFPNYQSVIPKESTISIRFDRDDLLAAFRQAALLTSDETRSVRVELENGKATLSAHALDAGEATIELDAPDYTAPEPLSIAFNPDYVIDGLKVIDGDEVSLELTRANAPAMIGGESGFYYVIMPITLRNA